MSWYKQNQATTSPSLSYLGVGHESGDSVIVWGHDGRNLLQRQVVNDLVNGKIEKNGHDELFTPEERQSFIAGGRVEIEKSFGSFSAANNPNQYRLVQKAVNDVLSAFPGVRFVAFRNGFNIGTLTMQTFASSWYARYKFSEVPEEDLGMIRDFSGIEVNVENSAGTERVGVNGKGKEWRTKMKYDYGFVCSIKGVDGDALDVYLGPDQKAKNVYVVHQVNPETGEYDEDKCMLGFDSPERAKKEYLAHYDSPKFFGTMTTVPFSEFKKIVEDGDKQKVNWKKKGKRTKV